MSQTQLGERICAYLAKRNVATLAIVDGVGPWAAPVFFANDDLTLYFVSDPLTRHGSAIGAGTKVAAAITEDHQDWTAIAGVQLEGFCGPVGQAERHHATKIYLAKFPFAAAFLDPAGPMYAQAGAKSRFYQLAAKDVWFTDNRLSFGHREHLSVKK